jgi:hypothetical protein
MPCILKFAWHCFLKGKDLEKKIKKLSALNNMADQLSILIILAADKINTRG